MKFFLRHLYSSKIIEKEIVQDTDTSYSKTYIHRIGKPVKRSIRVKFMRYTTSYS